MAIKDVRSLTITARRRRLRGAMAVPGRPRWTRQRLLNGPPDKTK